MWLQLINVLLVSLATFLLTFHFVLLLFSFAFRKKKFGPTGQQVEKSLACVITAYKDLSPALPLIQSILDNGYKNFRIYCVADRCEQLNVTPKDERLFVLYPEMGLNSKVKSMLYAVEHFKGDHDAVIIFDPDNLVKPGYLECMNRYLHRYGAVQGERIAKNLDSNISGLDALGELYHNYLERYVPFLLGSSSTIAGSGMAIETRAFRSFLASEEVKEKIDGVILGEDKMLQSHLVGNGIRIAYNKEAKIYDEKLVDRTQVANQRSRWVMAYIKNLKDAFGIFGKGLARFNWNQVFFGITTIYPPLFTVVLFSGLCALYLVVVDWPLAIIVAFGMFLFASVFFLVLILEKAPKSIWLSILSSPLFILGQVKGVLQFRKTKNDFLVTKKSKVVTLEKLKNE